VRPSSNQPSFSPTPPAAVDWAVWNDELARTAPLGDLFGSSARVLVVGAHPDDETIGAGQLVADARVPVEMLTLTAGERCLDHAWVDPTDMGINRVAEWRAAVSELGAAALDTPHWPDGRLGDHEPALTDLIAEHLEADSVVLAPWRHDPHPDHVASGRAAAAAALATGAALVEYPVWAPYWLTPADVQRSGHRLRVVSTSVDAAVRQRRALRHYSSQLVGLFPGWDPVVPADLVSRHDRQLVAHPCA